MNERPEQCPCGSALPFARCCGPCLNGAAQPKTAEQLMRSRYTAYVLGDTAYLLATWHPTTRPSNLRLEPAGAVKWLGLKILRTHLGMADDQRGEVEFVARYKIQGKAVRLHESSEFVRDGGRWFYVSGMVDKYK